MFVSTKHTTDIGKLESELAHTHTLTHSHTHTHTHTHAFKHTHTHAHMHIELLSFDAYDTTDSKKKLRASQIKLATNENF